MAEHTPGRLHYQEKADVYTHILRTESGGHFVQLPQDRSGKAEADARRLVAAWNAAHDAGLSTEALEAGVVARLLKVLEDTERDIARCLNLGADQLARVRAAFALAKGAS